jgi:molybdate transport system ATP-binding protein
MIRFDAAITLGAFSLDAAFESDAAVLALFGRSGSGKSVTLALIAGLLRPDRGTIVVDGRVLADTENHVFVPKHERRIGLVYQDARLFPHLTVRQNLLFGRWFARKAHRLDPAQAPAERDVDFGAVVETFGIGHLLDRRPGRLSGGERQRVGIGRALLSSPHLLLMDEPLTALDDERKLEVMTLIERMRDEFKVPIVYVSHAVDEVVRLASQVVVLGGGRVIAAGPVGEVFASAAALAGESRFARSSVLTGRVAEQPNGYGLSKIAHPGGTIWLAGAAGASGHEVRVMIRATDVTLATERPQHLSIRTTLAGHVAAIEREDGPLAAVTVELDGGDRLLALATRMAVDELGLKPGDRVFALVKTVALDERNIASRPTAPANRLSIP